MKKLIASLVALTFGLGSTVVLTADTASAATTMQTDQQTTYKAKRAKKKRAAKRKAVRSGSRYIDARGRTGPQSNESAPEAARENARKKSESPKPGDG